jgi:hypothetical protein
MQSFDDPEKTGRRERRNLMSTQEITSTNKLQEFSMTKAKGKYTLGQILGI